MKKVSHHNITIDNHKINIWDNKYVVLKHPQKCDFYEDDMCRNKIIKYLEDEGYLNFIEDSHKILVFDSYVVDNLDDIS